MKPTFFTFLKVLIILCAWFVIVLPAPTPVPIEQGTLFEEIGNPVRIMIPSIGVDARVDPVGITDAGAMAVPTEPLRTGWYQFGTRPGEVGSAVIAGHVNWTDGAPAVFQDLKNVAVGDQVTIEDESGKMYIFRVDVVKEYAQDADPKEVFTSDDGGRHLNLVTCGGVWDPEIQTHTLRLIVFATQI